MKNNYISKVFQWLFLGLIITFGLGYYMSTNESTLLFAYEHYIMFIILELGCGFGLTFFINKLSDGLTKIFYILFAGLTGVTFGSIFIIYEMSSIMWVVLATAIIFGVFGFIGKSIKKDLTGFGTFLLIALLSMLVLTFLNMFILKEALDLTIALVSVVIFAGYITFDINRIVKMSDFNPDEKYAVYGAFQLYLDIINIIIDLLRIFGNRRD